MNKCTKGRQGSELTPSTYVKPPIIALHQANTLTPIVFPS